MRRKIWEFVISKKLRIGILIKRIYGISDKNSKHIPCGRTTTIDPLGEERIGESSLYIVGYQTAVSIFTSHAGGRIYNIYFTIASNCARMIAIFLWASHEEISFLRSAQLTRAIWKDSGRSPSLLFW